MHSRTDANVYLVHGTAVTEERTGRRGRPRKVIDHAILQESLEPMRKITQKKLAKILGVHRHTLRRYLSAQGLQLSYRSEISDEELDAIVRTFCTEDRPDSGESYLLASLRHHGLNVQRWRVRDSQKRVDQVGVHIRTRNRVAIQRQVYVATRPNARWHMDGYHKLILFGFIIHGVVDGYSRKVNAIFLTRVC